MLDRLDALERDVRTLLSLEPIRAEILKRQADNAELQDKGREDARKAETELQDKQRAIPAAEPIPQAHDESYHAYQHPDPIAAMQAGETMQGRQTGPRP